VFTVAGWGVAVDELALALGRSATDALRVWHDPCAAFNDDVMHIT
jgi:hypothetical protein